MKCNVCGNEDRCYRIYEIGGMPMPPRQMNCGMLFCICATCLGRLIDLIRTEATKVETPADRPLDEQVARRQEKIDGFRNKPQ